MPVNLKDLQERIPKMKRSELLALREGLVRDKKKNIITLRRSEEYWIEYTTDVVEKLFDDWSGINNWMEEVKIEARRNWMWHYPNKRIRHLWGYIDDDKQTHSAMDRRSVNSGPQGFASDIGVVSVYLINEWVEVNIRRNGFDLDMKSTNIVHDAQYSDVLFEHVPMSIYLTEHAMSTMPMDYYKRVFGYEISIPLSFGLEMGQNWASLQEWEGFREDKLCDMLRDYGKSIDKPSDKVIEDVKYLLRIRHKELKTNPYKMLVTNDNVDRLFRDLHMFKDQKAA